MAQLKLSRLTDTIDATRAEAAARRIVLAYELLDDLAAHAEDSDELHAEAVAVMFIALAVATTGIGMPQKEAPQEFCSVYREVNRARGKLGAKSTAREIVTELHLDQRKERKR